MPRIVVCIPTYQERENIEALIPQILNIFEENRIDGKILIVDDNSPDGTGEVVKEFIKTDSNNRIDLLSRPKKEGLGAAYIAGFIRALEFNPEIIMEMDADFSHNPKIIPFLVWALDGKILVKDGEISFVEEPGELYDVAIGSRKIPGGRVENWGIHRRLISGGANTITHFALGMKTKDVTSGFRAIRASFLEKEWLERLKTSGYAFQLELLFQLIKFQDARVIEVPIVFEDRKVGVSKLGGREIFEFFFQVLKLFLKRIWGVFRQQKR